MPSLNKRSQWLVALALFAAAVALTPNVSAQGKSSNAQGPSSGTLGGGASGASNRGGASGISNPNPGGSPASLGGPTQSNGPQATEASRSGYIGARTTTPVTPPQPPGTMTLSVAQFGKCPTVGISNPQARMSGNNMGRIDIVAQYLNQGQESQSGSTARFLLADMQEELEKSKPDLMLAGTYLGIASGMPVTSALVAEVSESLCSPVSRGVAEAIAPVAEAQRKRLLLGR